MPDFETYLSPFTWRYGSPAMRRLWSEHHNRLLWRRLWVTLAQVQSEFGHVSAAQLQDIRAHAEDIDLQQSFALESQIHHDLMAELKVFAGQCTVGGGVLHLGATSMDIKDNADVLRMRASLDLILEKLAALLEKTRAQIIQHARTPIIAFTHLQPAEPSTLGYRFSQYAQDLLDDYGNLLRVKAGLRGKGFRGAVGTAAAFGDLLGVEHLPQFEARLSDLMDLPFYPVSSQTYPRKQDYAVISALAGLGASLYKIAFDLRILQSPPIGELAEPFSSQQVGSSAMPFKRNPILAEKTNSLARSLAQLPRLAWDNAAHSLLERTLDDSANRRTMLPEAFLGADELLQTAARIFDGLNVDEAAMQRNLAVYGPFAATERVLVALVKAGADRQVVHAQLRELALAAWESTRQGHANPLVESVCTQPEFAAYVPPEELRTLMGAQAHTGDAAQRASALAEEIGVVLGRTTYQKQETHGQCRRSLGAP